MQAIDNLSALSGTVIARRPHPSLPDHDLVTLAVGAVAPVPGRADLLGRSAGGMLDVAVPRARLDGVGPSTKLRLRARQTPNGAIAESDPAPEDFVVER